MKAKDSLRVDGNVVTLTLSASFFVFLTMILAVVLFILTQFQPSGTPAAPPAPTCPEAPLTGELAPECATGVPCMLGYFLADLDVCEQRQAPTGAACQDACYVANATNTTCRGDGTCAGPPSECRGYCTADIQCNTTIPINLFWLQNVSNPAPVIGPVAPVLWNYFYECQFNRCELFTLDLYWKANAIDNGAQISAPMRCHELLDVNWTNARGSCVVAEDFLLDTNMTNSYFPGDAPALPHQFRMCSFYYACAPFTTPYVWTKRDATRDGDDRLKSVAARLLADRRRRSL